MQHNYRITENGYGSTAQSFPDHIWKYERENLIIVSLGGMIDKSNSFPNRVKFPDQLFHLAIESVCVTVAVYKISD